MLSASLRGVFLSRTSLAAVGLIVASGGCALAATPINDLGTGLYQDQYPGGLYPGGNDTPTLAHDAEGRARSAQITPLDAAGSPDADGKYVFLSIGMSNTTQEFSQFIVDAAADPRVNHTELVILNGAASGQASGTWDSPTDSNYNRIRDNVLTPQGLSEAQVRAAWVKTANAQPAVSLPNVGADAFRLTAQMGDISRALQTRYPNLEVILLSSRIYAGYATSTLNPEPYAYESGFAVKWLIESQIDQMAGGGVDPLAGDMSYSGSVPWVGWGPYMWADGLNARSDGLTWAPNELAADGTHPSALGTQKVSNLLMDHLLTSPYTQDWFVVPEPHMPGDFDIDIDVDGYDFLKWQRGESPNPLSASDLAAWEASYGTVPPLTANSLAVPEPSIAVLLIALAAVSILPRCRGCAI